MSKNHKKETNFISFKFGLGSKFCCADYNALHLEKSVS
jgi:hypothetical protein